MRTAAMAILLATALGCGTTIGVVEYGEGTTTTTLDDGSVQVSNTPGGACRGLTWWFGEQDLGCAGGGPISVPGSQVLSGLFEGLARIGEALIPGGTTVEVNVPEPAEAP